MRNKIKNDLMLYQYAHQNKWNAALHYVAFLFAFIGWLTIFINIWVTVMMAVLHYTLASVGHMYFEKNSPGAIKRPWLGFYAGFLWFFMRTFELLTGKKVLPHSKN
jgi:hypothetical protein